MNLMDILKGAGGMDKALGAIGAKVGLGPDQVLAAASVLLPVITGAIEKKRGSENLDEDFEHLGVLPDSEITDDTYNKGNQLLGKLLGPKDASREVAARASKSTGIGVDKIKALLPLLASLAAGVLASRAREGGQKGKAGSVLDMLDFDGDGSPLDDLAGLAGKFLRR